MDRPLPDLSNPSPDPRAIVPVVQDLLHRRQLEDAERAMQPLLPLVRSDFWIGRLHASCAGDAAWALHRWRAQVSNFPHEPQAVLDLAQFIRLSSENHDEADAVIEDALARFPDELWLLDSAAVAAERRGAFEQAASRWQRLLTSHPDHQRAQHGLVQAWLRLGQLPAALAAADAVLPMQPSSADLRSILANTAEQGEDWANAAYQWRAVRQSDTSRIDGWLGEARMLSRLGGRYDGDRLLTEAHRTMPDAVPLAIAWAHSAGELQDWPEAARRARLVMDMAPDAAPLRLLLGQSLIQSGQFSAAVPLLAQARAQAPDDVQIALLEIQALMLLHRWQGALEASAAAYNRFRETAEPGRLLTETLKALERHDQAMAVLRDLRQRFPQQRWVLVRLAALVPRAEAVSLWREAGLPEQGDETDLLAYAASLPESEALPMLQRVATRLSPGAADLARARILHNQGDLPGAAALWREIAPQIASQTPGYLALTVTLAGEVEARDAAPMIEALLNEPDQPGLDWRPALGVALAGRDKGPMHARTLAVLATRPERTDNLATAVARNLCGPMPDADTLALRIARAVSDGRRGVAALLLGQNDPHARVSISRIAFRLFLNQQFIDAERVARLDPPRLVLLLELARAYDPECLAYLRELARPLYKTASLPDLPSHGDVIGAVAHAQPGPRSAGPTQERLRIALCVHGRMGPDDQGDLIDALGLDEHEVSVFAHLWQGAPTAPPPQAELLERLPDGLYNAMADLGLTADPVATMAAYPNLFTVTAQGSEPAVTSERWTGPTSVIEPPPEPGLPSHGPGRLARMKVYHAHRLAAERTQASAPFDLYVHLRADTPCRLTRPDWTAMAHALCRGVLGSGEAGSRVVFADQGYHLRPLDGLSVGATLMIGGLVELGIAADSFALAEMIASGRASVAGLAAEQSEQGSLGAMLHLCGVEVVPIAIAPRESRRATPLPMPPLTPAQALARLWQDLRARPPEPHDAALLRAATAEVCGSVGV